MPTNPPADAIKVLDDVARALSECGAAADWEHALEAARAVIPVVREHCAKVAEGFGETATSYGPAQATRKAIAAAIRGEGL